MPVMCECGRRFWQQQDGRPIEKEKCPFCLNQKFKTLEDNNGTYICEVK